LFLLREPARGATEHRDLSASPDETPGWRSYSLLWKYPRYLLVIAGYVAQTFAMGGFSFWAPTFLVRVHHMELAEAGGFFGRTLVLMGLLATLGGGYCATIWQRKTGTGYAWVLALSALGAIPAAFASFSLQDLAQAKLALAASMFLLFLCTGPLNTLILETVPVRMRASAVAASIFSIHLFGDLWSPKFIGYLSDRSGNLQQACRWALPGALVISAIFWSVLVVTERRKNAAGG
jgi:hypothetical protein